MPVAAAMMPIGIGLQAQRGPNPYPVYWACHLAGTMETLGLSLAAALWALEAVD